MSPIYILDHFYLIITFLISLTIQSIAFIVSYTFQFDTITDLSAGFNFFILTLITLLCGQTFQSRNYIVSLSLMIWSIRLAIFLLFRVLKRGHDDRFNQMRTHFFKFGAFWSFQLLWVWIASLPITVLNSPNISSVNSNPIPFGTASDILGLIFFLLGITLETLADTQKFRWKTHSSNSDFLNQLPVCQIGLWKWSRHPNYFGEILLWWGIWLMAIGSANNPGVNSSSKRLLQATVISPTFVTIIILFLSGLPTAEKPVHKKVFIKSFHVKLDQNLTRNPPLSSSSPHSNHSIQDDHHEQPTLDLWKQYQIYLNSTSILFPIPSFIYQCIPNPIKRTLLLDWSIYRFDSNSDQTKQLILELTSESHS